MSRIDVNNLTFYYEGSFDNIFENVSFSIDTDWKLGLIGRNGKGKTTFLNLLLGKYEYSGSIRAGTNFDYFPYFIPEDYAAKNAADFLEQLKPGCEFWRMLCELNDLELDAEVLYRPFGTLSPGERTKVMLAVLFSDENEFLLIDEPTNHLDQASRETVKAYLGRKKGFILVSHDRDLLDACINHVLVLNRQTIEVQSGNFSSWWENKERKDAFARMENEKHLKEIGKLKKAASRAKNWADKNEKTKIGFDPLKEPERNIATRAYIGAKTKKMQSRVKQMEYRLDREIREKEGLLQDIEQTVELKLAPLSHHKERLLTADGYGLGYVGGKEAVFQNLRFTVEQGERVFLNGKNGCGKTSLLKAVLAAVSGDREQEMKTAGLLESGILQTASGIIVSYVNQDTSFLKGTIGAYCHFRGLDESLFCAVLHQLGTERVQFAKPMEDYSEGQKKKVLIAASLLTPAHLYIWDEPLNYMDLFSRMQIEELLLTFRPTLLAVEHDIRFQEKVATKVIRM